MANPSGQTTATLQSQASWPFGRGRLLYVGKKSDCPWLPEGASVTRAAQGAHARWRRWPGIMFSGQEELDSLTKSCLACLAVKQAPAKAPLHPWIWPSTWILQACSSKSTTLWWWMHSPSELKWLKCLRQPQTWLSRCYDTYVFATHGISKQIVSDNGPQFASADFAEFAQANGIRHTRTSAYHPASNGEAEKFVHTFKEAMKARKGDRLTLQHWLENFCWHTTPLHIQ